LPHPALETGHEGRHFGFESTVEILGGRVNRTMSHPAGSVLKIGSEPINLTQVLKRVGWVMSGGEAKSVIAAGDVCVNGEVELRKRRQMKVGDIVSLEGGQSVELRGED
jgi:ribosome-associated protein